MKNEAIGVFDSGIGGLTVLESLIKEFPHEKFIYIADQGMCPYGTRTDEDIEKIVIRVAKYLESLHVKAIVVACNTASLFIKSIQDAVKIKVISVIQPTCEKAIMTSQNKKIGVIATNATIKKCTYQNLLEKAHCESFPVPCSEFVDCLEHHQTDMLMRKELVNQKLSTLKDSGIDTLIYGCTHFSLLEPEIRECLGNIHYIPSGDATAVVLKKYLQANNLESNLQKGSCIIYTTGDPIKAYTSMKWFQQGKIIPIKLDI